MNILFLTLSRVADINERGIYTDLVRSLLENGNNVYVASPTERRFHQDTHLVSQDESLLGKLSILKVRTLNIQKTNVIEKGFGTLLLERQFLKALNKYWKDIKFDLLIYSTPPITFNKVIETLKNSYQAKTYLMLKDIFPQNAVDLEMFSKKSLIYKLFRKKETKLYLLSDKIGCMSPANEEYIIKHNPEIDPSKVEVFPNSMIPLPYAPIAEKEKNEIIEKLGIDSKKTISLYGGNLGKPQGIDFLIQVLVDNEKRNNSHFIIVGDGTEYNKLKEWFDEHNPQNATLKSGLPKADYDKLIKIADIGLIFLDHRFTIPNFPSRLLSYIENAIPVMIASDPNSDQGRIAEREGFGYWAESNSLENFNRQFEKLVSNKDIRDRMGEKGRKYFEENLDVREHIEKILR